MSIRPQTANYDAVIVLANQMDVDGELNLESKARAEEAVKIYKQYGVNFLVTCGWAYRSDTDIAIGNAFKKYIVDELGVKSSKVIEEINSRDTVGDAFFTKKNVVMSYKWQKLCIVTSNYHVKRTQEIFNFIYGSSYDIKVIGANLDYCESILEKELLSTKIFRETFSGVEVGNDLQIFNRLSTDHPFYNGKVYSKISKSLIRKI